MNDLYNSLTQKSQRDVYIYDVEYRSLFNVEGWIHDFSYVERVRSASGYAR